MPYTFLIGGARSGKSRAAIHIAASSGREVVYLATATPGDEEMASRIAAHRRERPAGWSTVEEPLDLVSATAGVDHGSFLVLDCLTLWLSNAMGADWSDDRILSTATELIDLLAERPGGAVVVSNEVGSGIVPMEGLVRRYRDMLGLVNSRCASRAADSWLMVAGRALALREPPRHSAPGDVAPPGDPPIGGAGDG